MNTKVAVLFSGGTDSCAAAYLACEEFNEIYLLTFFEKSTEKSPLPIGNFKKLQALFPNKKITHHSINTDLVVKKLSYHNFIKNIWHFHFYNLATPGISSLSWHFHTIQFCIDHKIQHVYDGMTAELQHLPGHMPAVRELFKDMYQKKNIYFSGPVYNWPVPRNRQFVEQVIINKHNSISDDNQKELTTGLFLYEKKFFTEKNIKGTQLDFEMQHDCYPFIIYNLFCFWLISPFLSWPEFEMKIVNFIENKIAALENIKIEGV